VQSFAPHAGGFPRSDKKLRFRSRDQVPQLFGIT